MFRAVTGLLLAAAVLAVPAPAAAGPAARTVTLITGDRVTVSGGDVTRTPAPGREGVPLVTRTVHGHLTAVPADLLDLLAAGRLDPRLFDVTALLDGGYPARGHLPLIISLTGGPDAVRAAVRPAVVRDLDALESVAVRVDDAALAGTWPRLAATPYRKIWLDGTARPSIDVTVPLVGATAAWAAGYTARGVGVGVLDTGIDAGHPDLGPAVAEAADFTGDGDEVDRSGHGTHVASVIAGSGAASGGRFRGMAPDARLYAGKVCRFDTCDESAILAGMQWAARDRGLRVVNLSFGRPDEPGDDLLEAAVDTLTDRFGTLFVAAAGNSGGPVDSPASAGAALAVGASTRDDTVAAFSARGTPTGLKPELVAPGVDVVAARSADSARPRIGGREYTAMSGTSAAAAHVTGAAAILAGQHPEWTAARIEAALTGAATPLAGTGRLDVAKAVTAPVVADRPAVFLDDPGTRTLTYTNGGDQPVTLALDVSAGLPVRLGATALTVPAGGSAGVALTTTASAGPGPVAGVLTATAGDVSVRTAVGVEPRPARVGLTVRWLDRAGATARRTFGGVFGPDQAPLPGDGGTVYLAPGDYTVDGKVFDATSITLLSRPRLRLDRDTTITLDARAGRPMATGEPGQTAARATFTLPSGGGGSVQATTFDTMYAAQPGPAAPGVRTDLTATWPERTQSWTVPGLGGVLTPPVSGVRFTPDGTGAVRFEVLGGPVTRFGLDVSYDDGATWRTPMVLRIGDRGVARLRPGPATVRIDAADAGGSRFARTVRLTG